MAREPQWIDVGASDELKKTELQPVRANTIHLALSFRDGQFGAVSNACNHVGGPLGEGRIDKAGYIQCPWHGYKYHCRSGEGEPGFEADKVPAFPVKVEGGRVLVDIANPTRRGKPPHEPHPLARKPQRAPGPLRLAGISTTNMNNELPRFSGSDHLLGIALAAAKKAGAETKMVRLDSLKFRHCEGYFSKSLRACTWPCSITQMDPTDQLDQVYEALVHWADAIIVATPIRWGAPSSLYFKMVERLNCVQVDVATKEEQIILNKVAGFIIVGGQDNIQGVAGQMLSFFGELGFIFPKFPYIAHSRGWSHEDMENNCNIIRDSKALARGAAALAERCLEMAHKLVEVEPMRPVVERAGLKGRPVMADTLDRD
ncbi:MAG TPA: Rieske 2Fe-2S domain-containing protein [Xanthobacteraceae bacterium]|jgi:multimeric flavodoxin WrbA/nitrite reductase/ring-hydroxylating ferredoxin subunit